VNKLYFAGCLLIGAGAVCFYACGIQDAIAEVKRRERETWENANDSEMGSVANVRVIPDGERASSGSA